MPHRKGKLMKKSTKTFFTILLLGCMVLISAGCGNKAEDEVEALIGHLETSCNAMDANGVLECLDPVTASQLQLALDVIGAFADMDGEEFLNFMTGIMSLGVMSGEIESFPTISIDIDSIEADEETAVAFGSLSYEENGELCTYPVEFDCAYIEEQWYITGIYTE